MFGNKALFEFRKYGIIRAVQDFFRSQEIMQVNAKIATNRESSKNNPPAWQSNNPTQCTNGGQASS
jgi:hypothetical protein